MNGHEEIFIGKIEHLRIRVSRLARLTFEFVFGYVLPGVLFCLEEQSAMNLEPFSKLVPLAVLIKDSWFLV